MISKYPHTATISWYDTGTTNSVGGLTPGTLNTIVFVCDIQPVNGRYLLGEGGAVLNYDWKIFANRFTGDTSVPEDAKLAFSGADHILVHLFNFQKHTEIKCRD